MLNSALAVKFHGRFVYAKHRHHLRIGGKTGAGVRIDPGEHCLDRVVPVAASDRIIVETRLHVLDAVIGIPEVRRIAASPRAHRVKVKVNAAFLQRRDKAIGKVQIPGIKKRFSGFHAAVKIGLVIQ